MTITLNGEWRTVTGAAGCSTTLVHASGISYRTQDVTR